jgi:hypothetical protein
LSGVSKPVGVSVWKSGCWTLKRPQPNRTATGKDRKNYGPIRTATAVRSSVLEIFENSKTGQRPVLPVLTGLFGLVIENKSLYIIYN